jgi:hypothetical protein
VKTPSTPTIETVLRDLLLVCDRSLGLAEELNRELQGMCKDKQHHATTAEAISEERLALARLAAVSR